MCKSRSISVNKCTTIILTRWSIFDPTVPEISSKKSNWFEIWTSSSLKSHCFSFDLFCFSLLLNQKRFPINSCHKQFFPSSTQLSLLNVLTIAVLILLILSRHSDVAYLRQHYFSLSFRNVENTVHWAGISHMNLTRLTLQPVCSLFKTIWMTWISRRVYHGTLYVTCWERFNMAEGSQTTLINGF